VKQRPGKFPLLAPGEVAKLRPGGDREFDELMKQLIRGGPFL
jgi:hypothetical protein